ncbi:unnamed protein product [Rhodiola kirilowii]
MSYFPVLYLCKYYKSETLSGHETSSLIYVPRKMSSQSKNVI